MTTLAVAASTLASQPITSRLVTANDEELPLRALSLHSQAGAGFARSNYPGLEQPVNGGP